MKSWDGDDDEDNGERLALLDIAMVKLAIGAKARTAADTTRIITVVPFKKEFLAVI
jgi:hypothetical protein